MHIPCFLLLDNPPEKLILEWNHTHFQSSNKYPIKDGVDSLPLIESMLPKIQYNDIKNQPRAQIATACMYHPIIDYINTFVL